MESDKKIALGNLNSKLGSFICNIRYEAETIKTFAWNQDPDVEEIFDAFESDKNIINALYNEKIKQFEYNELNSKNLQDIFNI